MRVVKAGMEAAGGGRTAMASRVSLDQSSWQQSLLINAGVYYWLYKRHPWVRAIVDKTANACAVDAYAIEPVTGSLADAEDPRRAALETVLAGIGGPNVSLARLLRMIYVDVLINGTAYLRVMRLGNGQPASLKRVDFRTITPRLDRATGERVGYDLFTMGTFSLAPTTLPLDDVLCVQTDSMGDGGVALSKLEALDTSLTLDLSAIAVNLGYMQNGAKAGDVYSFGDTMSEDQVERERQYLKDNFSRPAQSYEPLFLAGSLSLIRDGHAGRNDMDFGKLRTLTREEVASVLHMPLSLLSTEQVGALGGNGREQDLLMWNNDVVAPLQDLVISALSADLVQGVLTTPEYKLVPPSEPRLRLELLQMAEIGVKIGMSGNQLLGLIGLAPVEGLDKPLFLAGRQSVVGIPGDPESIVYTTTGAVSGDIQAPALPSPTPPTTVPDAIRKATPDRRLTSRGRPSERHVHRLQRAYETWAETHGAGDL